MHRIEEWYVQWMDTSTRISESSVHTSSLRRDRYTTNEIHGTLSSLRRRCRCTTSRSCDTYLVVEKERPMYDGWMGMSPRTQSSRTEVADAQWILRLVVSTTSCHSSESKYPSLYIDLSQHTSQRRGMCRRSRLSAIFQRQGTSRSIHPLYIGLSFSTTRYGPHASIP
jgi:hypothetical protein